MAGMGGGGGVRFSTRWFGCFGKAQACVFCVSPLLCANRRISTNTLLLKDGGRATTPPGGVMLVVQLSCSYGPALECRVSKYNALPGGDGGGGREKWVL